MSFERAEGRVRGANDTELHVEQEGAGPAVLLLHGFPDSVHLWRGQIPALAEAGHQTIAFDLRGFGRSDRPADVDAYRIELSVRDAMAVLDSIGVERATVVGHDWGAVVAWALAAAAPERVERLVALSVGHPAGFWAPSQWAPSWYMLFFQFRGVAERALRRDDWRMLRGFLRGGDVDRYVRDLGRPGALAAALNWYRANVSPTVIGADVPWPMPPVSCPTLGVWGSADVALTEGQMTRSARHVDGEFRYERLEGVGHWIPTEATEQLNRLLLEFLE